jgi:hypothetical protein
MSEGKISLKQLLAAALISGTVASALVSVIFAGYMARVEQEIRSRRAWKEQSVAELLGPMNIQFDRTQRAFDRWTQKNLYIEVKVIKVGNETIRNLLLERGHLIPPELLEDASKLIEHYDVWLELFERQRGGSEPDLETPFTYAGPAGYPFPKESATRFKQKYEEYWKELYGDG